MAVTFKSINLDICKSELVDIVNQFNQVNHSSSIVWTAPEMIGFHVTKPKITPLKQTFLRVCAWFPNSVVSLAPLTHATFCKCTLLKPDFGLSPLFCHETNVQ